MEHCPFLGQTSHHDHTGGCIPFMSMCILSNFQNTSHHISTSWWLRPILGFNPIEASASQAGALSRCSRAASWFLPQVRTTNDWSQIQDQNHCLRTRLPHIQSHAVPAFIKFAMQTRSDCSFYDWILSPWPHDIPILSTWACLKMSCTPKPNG